MDIPLHSDVFAHLYDCIKKEAASYLKGLGKELAPEHLRNHFIGYNPSEQYKERNISYAIKHKLTGGQLDQWQHRGKGDGAPFNARELYDLVGKFVRKQDEKLEVSERYLGYYLQFIGKETFQALLEGLSEEVRKAQRKLMEPAPALAQTLHYRCFYWSDEKEELVAFRACFTSQGRTGTVVLDQLPSEHVYEGSFEVIAATNTLSVQASTSPAEGRANVRPLAIQISKDQRRPFHDMAVCVGCYLNISTQNQPQTGYIVFERVADPTSPSALEEVMLIEYLCHLLTQRPKEMAFSTKEDFAKAMEKMLPNAPLQAQMLARFRDTRYVGFVLTDKDHQPDDSAKNYLDMVRFRFVPSGRRFTCEAAYPHGVKIYTGTITYLPPYKLLLHFNPTDVARYQVVLDTRGYGEGQLRGVYGGISQEDNPAAGRVILYRTPVEEFEIRTPRLFNLTRGEHLGIVASYPELPGFFSGQRDHFVDDPTVMGPIDLSFVVKADTDLGWVAGVYYYYRTLKIRGKVLQVKRYPILIYPNGRVRTKVRPQGGIKELDGFAFREQNGRIYIHQEIEGRYGGLCIMYPDQHYVDKPPVVIRAIYASASQDKGIFGGRIYFVRQSAEVDEALFDRLSFGILDTQNPDVLADLGEEERRVVQSLAGQLNNYIGFRNHNEDVDTSDGQHLFYAACEYGRRGQHEEALRVLKRAILRGGFHDIGLLREAMLPPSAPLAALHDGFRQWPENLYHERDLGQKQDEYDFVAPIVRQVLE